MIGTPTMPDLPTDYASFLARQRAVQHTPLAAHLLNGQTFWLRRANTFTHPVRGGLLALAARLSRTPALRPLPPAPMAREVEQLREFSRYDIPVPEIVASDEGGFLLRDPNDEAQTCLPLSEALLQVSGADATLGLWLQGLALLDTLHAAGLSLGGALAGDLLVCSNGTLACTHLDASALRTLSAELCQVRDALGWLWSTAGLLHQAGLREAARPLWNAWVARPVRSDAFRSALAQHLLRLSWLRYLPPDSRWGSAIYQMRAGYELAVRPRYGDATAPDTP